MSTLRRIQLKTRSSLILRLIDAYTCSAPLNFGMEISLENLSQKPLYKPEGYVIFTELLPGNYVLHLRSKWYEPIELVLKVELGEEPVIVQAILIPRPNYPVGQGVTVVRGKVVDKGGKPVQGMKIQAKLSGKSFAKARLSQGVQMDQEVLALNYVNGRIRVGEQFWLSDGSGSEEAENSMGTGEAIQVTDVSEDAKREIGLKQPLRFQYKKGSFLSTLITSFSSTNGEIAIFFPDERFKHYEAQLFFHSGSTVCLKEVRLEEGSMHNLGVISLAD